jgi:hypothetical protein
MGLISGKRMVPEGEPFAEALQGGARGGGISFRFLVQDRFKTFDHQTPHGRLLLGGGNFHPLQEWVGKVNGGSHRVITNA